MAKTTSYPAETHTRKVTSFLPLTTAWKPSEGCEIKFRLDGPSLMAFDPAYGVDVEEGVTCGPPAVTSWWQGAGSSNTDFSIGPLTCPEDWATVASSTKDFSSTLEMCCPSGYFLFAGTPGQAVGDCLSNVPKGMVLTFGSTAYDDSTSWSMATTTLADPSTVGAIAIKGWNINIPETTSIPMPSSTTRTSTSISTTESPSNTAAASGIVPNNLSTSNSGSAEELSTGAKAGIGIGAGVGAIGIIALLVALYLFRQKKQRPQLNDAAFSNPSPMAYQPSETMTMRSEVPYQYHYTAELDGMKSPAELGPGVRSPRF